MILLQDKKTYEIFLKVGDKSYVHFNKVHFTEDDTIYLDKGRLSDMDVSVLDNFVIETNIFTKLFDGEVAKKMISYRVLPIPKEKSIIKEHY